MVASYENSKEELEEFQTSSRELELELESQLETSEKKNKEFDSCNSRLKMEVETLRVSASKLVTDNMIV